ncbi:MAG: minor capsid protein, partial [Comamonas sp.]|nr:minor capsid protein [Comamonas sp.]
FNAYDLWHSEHGRAFTISRLARADLLEALQQSLAKSVAGDLTRRDWINNAEQLLQDAGWWGVKEVIDPRTGELLKTRFNHARLQLIFDTNVRQAAAAGQWQRMLRHQRTHPYARYVSMNDGRTRELHRSWHNVTLPLDDPWWSTHRPPNGWRCRCRVIGVTQAEYDRGTTQSRPNAATDGNAPLIEEPLKKQAPEHPTRAWRNPATGHIHHIPAGIDPGFDHNPGTQGRSQAFEALVQAKLARLSAGVRQAALGLRLSAGLPTPDFMGQRPGLADLPPMPVTVLTGEEFGKHLSHTELMAEATQLLKEVQASDGLVNDDTGWLLTVNRKGVKKMGDNKEQSTATLQTIAALQELVRRAVVVERHADTAHENEYVLAILRLMVPVKIGGLVYRVKLTVKEFRQGREARTLLHALEAVEIENAPLGTLPNSPLKEGMGTTQPTTGRTISISELLKNALDNAGQPYSF